MNFLTEAILIALRYIMLFCVSLFLNQSAYAEGRVEENGDKLQNLILFVGLGSTVFYEKGNEGSIQFFKSFISSQIVTEGLKLAIDKERPNGNCCNSFPSGHASKSFMGASFIHKRYGWEFGIPSYIVATYVGYSRVHADKHYVEDVLAGAVIGVVSSFYFTTPYKDLELSPFVNMGVYGANISYKW